MGGQRFVTILEKINNKIKVSRIWPLNVVATIENFSPNKMFIRVEEEGVEEEGA
jgi:hypothetical protein